MSPPVFADSEKTRLARLSHVMIPVSFTVILLLCIVTFFDAASPLSPLLFKVCVWLGFLLVVAFILVRRGLVRLANQVLNCAVLFIFIYEAVYLDNGIHSIGYGLLYLAVLHAGILLGRRAAFINAGFAIVVGIILQYTQHNQLLPVLHATPSDYFRLAAYGGGLTIAASISYLAMDSLRQAITRLHQNEAVQAETTRSLQHEISERRAHEREQVAVLAMASAMRKAATYNEIVPIILDKTIELLGGSASALSRFTGSNNQQIVEFSHGVWQAWVGGRLTKFPAWEKLITGNSTVYVNNAIDKDLDFPFAAHLNQVSAIACVLLEGSELQIGALWLGSQQPIMPPDLQILAAIGSMVANALQRIQLHAETRNRAEQLAEINHLGQFIAETLDLAKIYGQIGQTTRAVLPEISDLFIELYDAEENDLKIVYAIQDDQPVDVTQLSTWGGALSDLNFQHRSALARPSALTLNVSDDPAESKLTRNVGNKAVAYVPMAARGEIVGVLQVRSKILRRFLPIDLEFLTLLANTAAIFIQNAILFENLQQSNHRAQAELAERKQAEATIRRHLTAMESSLDGIAMLDHRGAFIYVNDAFAGLYGYPHPQALLGKKWRALYQKAEIQQFKQTLIPELVRMGKWRGETTGRRQNGRPFQQEISLVLLETGEVTAVVRDITERKDAEEALRGSQKLESLGVLAGGIAHDFNNFLAGMLGQISLAKAKLPSENPAYRHIEKAITSATRAADLTRQLLAYAGKGNFQVSRVDINDLIRDNVSLLETVVPKQVQLVFDLSSDLPPIEADIGQIQQVVMNLIMNAAEAVGDTSGQVMVQSQMRMLTDSVNANGHYIGVDQLAPGDYVCLAVSDNGAGMDRKVIDRIFDPFFSTKGQGRGLGLSATLGIIRAHKGGLQVESQLNVGSTFRVFLPATAMAQSIVSANADIIIEKLEGTVLLIDDEESVRDSFGEILEMAGLYILKATNGLEGIELFKQHQPEISIVLLDVHMPVMNGLDALRELKRIDPHIHVILSSGYSEYAIDDHVLNQPTITFLQKPYTMEAVMQRLAEHLKVKAKVIETN